MAAGRRLARAALLAGAAAVIGLAVGCSDGSTSGRSASSGFNPFPTSGSSGAAPPVTAGPVALQAGDCFDTDQFAVGQSIDRLHVHVVPCVAPHQHEVIATFTYPDSGDGAWPGDAVLDQWANDHCIGAFAGYVGIDYDRSTLDIATLRPERPGWDAGDRDVACAVHDADFKLLTAPVKGSAK